MGDVTRGEGVCVCAHFTSQHVFTVGCIALISGRRNDPLRCDCREFVLAGEQPALFAINEED